MVVRTMSVAGQLDLNLLWAMSPRTIIAVIMIPTLVGDLLILIILTIRITIAYRMVSIMDPTNRL